MARIHGLAVLFAVAGGTALWFAVAHGPETAPPWSEEPAARAAAATPTAATPAPAERIALPPDTNAPGTNAPDTNARAAASAVPAAPTAAPPPNVTLFVRGLAQRTPLAAFRWRFQPAGGDALAGAGTDGRAELTLPPVPGRLLVEAEGCAASQQELTPPAADRPAATLDLFLAPAATAAGVVLTARDANGAPVERLRIDLWLLAADAPPLAADEDPAHDPLWRRGATADDGRFVLPPLAAGNYALRAQPISADDLPRPLQPWRARFSFAGHEAVPLAGEFVPGIVLGLEVDGTAGRCDVVVTTRAGELPVWWRSVAGTQTAVGRDVVLAPGRATTLVALPPGDYAVALRDGALTTPARLAGEDGGVRRFVAERSR